MEKKIIEQIEECRKMASETWLELSHIDNCLELTDEIDAGTNATIANLLSLIKLVRKEANASGSKASELELKLLKLKDE